MGISKEQALDCLRSADLIGLGMEADAVRRMLHPENVVSYAVDVLVSASEDSLAAVEPSNSGSMRLAESGRDLTFGQLEARLHAIQQRFPASKVHGPSGATILQMADLAGLSIGEAVVRLRDAGVRSLAGDGFEAGNSQSMLELHRCAHRVGLRSAAGMVFGAGESLEQRVEHLFTIRALQEETGGFIAFTPWSFRPAAGSGTDAPTAVEYMRTLAVSRMVLDNFDNIESNCVAQGLKVIQMALRFGANDAGAIPVTGDIDFTEEDLRRVIRDAGFKPVERDTLYQTMFLGN